jgi:LemA protein
MLIGIAVLAVILIIVIWAIATSNRFKRLIVRIEEADSGIDVALTKRYDTLTKLLDVVRAYAKHEVETFTKIVNLRQGMSLKEKADAVRQLDQMATGLNVVAENYPQLRSTENYNQLQDAVVDAEAHLQAARRAFNMNVSAFNQAIVVFPASIIANNAHYTQKEFFEADEEKKNDVKMDL